MSEAAEEEAYYGCPTCLSVFRLGFSRCPIDGDVLQKLVDDPLVGTIIADRYLIEECIGEGGMGRVYRARHQRVSRRFAIKVLFGDLSTDPKMRGRFGREAEAASRLSHPNVISVMDFGETAEGLLYLAMDFVEGPELQQVIEEEGPFSSDRVIAIVKQLCLGLGHAHAEGLVHRDFKGENVILSRRGGQDIPRIVDFGIAVMLEDADARLTTEGVVIGTPACMSPEQTTGGDIDGRTDLFSLGVVMYEMLAGVKPFAGDPMTIARQNLACDPPPIRERVPGLEVHAELEGIARKLMEKRPEDRFQTADEVRAALEKQEASQAPALRAIPMTERSTVGMTVQTRKRLPRALVGTSALVLIVAVGAVLWMRGDDTSGDNTKVAIASSDAGLGPGAPTPTLAAPAIDEPGLDAASAIAGAPGADASTAKPRQRSRKRTLASGDATSEQKVRISKPASRQPSESGAAKEPKVGSRDSQTPPTSRKLTRLYVSVGESIQRLRQSNPEKVTRYRKQYAAIPFNDALRVPALRSEVEKKLHRLYDDIKAESDR